MSLDRDLLDHELSRFVTDASIGPLPMAAARTAVSSRPGGASFSMKQLAPA
jgi:hypothetical protein